MTELMPITNSGIVSLSGFAYQIKVFLLYLSQISEGQQVEFETLDDISVTDIRDNDKKEDFCFKRVNDNDGHIMAIQVKQANVSTAIGRKVLYNWLLAYSAEPCIGKFLLCTEQGRSISEAVFNDRAEQEYQTIIESSESSTALVSRVKKIYGENFERFKTDYSFICEHREIKKLQIDSSLSLTLCQEFHATAGTVGPVFFNYRIRELFNRICSCIMDCALQRKPYVCTKNEFEQLCEEICNRISQDRFEPDYQAFCRNIEPLVQNKELMECREYRQLVACELPVPQIIAHIGWEQYYANIRQHYLSDARGDRITTTEDVAYYNHQNVIMELQEEGKDKPRLRLIKTKNCPISTLTNEFSRWGAYVYLTKENTQLQISWKDDSDKNGK